MQGLPPRWSGVMARATRPSRLGPPSPCTPCWMTMEWSTPARPSTPVSNVHARLPSPSASSTGEAPYAFVELPIGYSKRYKILKKISIQTLLSSTPISTVSMPRRKIRAHYEHMSEFETGRAIE
ncbi:hypothetical protein LAZ67_22000453 [Cordylochernes scorpioides]|uniref:Uncharacterized protein n=1 Tax=Cordylochernes scorpioides TaxID=51811 RepID=A0ABY6LR90_9ARAC|nr:hypothetical protein LAZ67_22000453 [Cordylochernes scorpioides]